MSARATTCLSGGHFDVITTLAISEHNLASGSDDCTICIWSPIESQLPVNKLSLEFPCTSIKFAQNKSDLIYASHGTNVCSYDLRNISSPIFNIKVSEDEVNSVDLLECEARLAAGDDTGAVRMISSDTGQLLRTLKKHDNICSSVQFRPNRNWQIISGGLDCKLVVSDWKETGRGVSIFEMSELLDLPEDEESEEADEDGQEVDDFGEEEEEEEESPDSSSIHSGAQSRVPRSSYSSDWSETNAEDEAVPYVTPRRTMPISEPSTEDESDNEATQLLDSARVSRRPTTSGSGLEHNVRIHMSQTDGNAYLASAMSTGWSRGRQGLPVNPPMINALAASRSGSVVAVGLASSSVELFLGAGKHLVHSESLYGHSRGVSALHMLQEDQFLLSGGNDKTLFVWPLATGDLASSGGIVGGTQVTHSHKIEAISGAQLDKVYLSDSRPVIHMMDLSLC